MMSLRQAFQSVNRRPQGGRVGAMLAPALNLGSLRLPSQPAAGQINTTALLQAFNRSSNNPAAVEHILTRKVGTADLASLPSKFLPFTTGSVAASTAATTQTPTPNASVQITELAIDDTNAVFFTVDSFIIGQQNQLLNGVAMPASYFSTKGTRRAIIGAPILTPGVTASIGFTNQDLAAHTLRGVFACVQVDGDC